jgi:hypothetical protein
MLDLPEALGELCDREVKRIEYGKHMPYASSGE